jgi:serine/threonine-protein kinase
VTTAVHPTAGIDVGAIIDGKYRVDALIGRGGMGAVYRARDLGLDRDVAIKIVRPDFTVSASARERFRREARLAARLQHPAIATVYDYGTLSDGSAYLVMEFVRGTDLRTHLAQGPLDAIEAIRLLTAVANAIDAAHREQVVHRDLKPENILLPLQGGQPKVVDFGVATLLSADGTSATGTIVGTPGYMAPEQLRGEAVDARTDVYSLAVMAYEMLSGRRPFGGVDDESGGRASGVPLPPAIEDVLRRAMSLQRDERPRTARALTDALAGALGRPSGQQGDTP